MRVWDTVHWAEIQNPLPIHSLTVTSIVFSHSDSFMLTVSRDRSWSICRRNAEPGKDPLSVVFRKEKAHARIIWDASWSPDDSVFATGSRDKTVRRTTWPFVIPNLKRFCVSQVKIWRTEAVTAEATRDVHEDSTITLDQPVKSIDFACTELASTVGGGLVLAIGLEDGSIQLYRGIGEEGKSLEWSCILKLDEQWV